MDCFLKGKLTDLSPNSRLFLACQNAILVDVNIYTEKEMGRFFYSCAPCLYQVLRKQNRFEGRYL